MDLKDFSLEDLLLTAIKSEVEAYKIYSGLAEQVKNVTLKDHLKFLAGEEEKHRKFLEDAYKEIFPEREIKLPEKTPVPLPSIHIEHELVKLSEVLEQGMKAELAAHEFYKDLAPRFEDNPGIKNMLLKLSEIEMKHYEILKEEKEKAEKTEDADIDWGMIHVGP